MENVDLLKLKKLVKTLNQANQAYYEKASPNLTDREYDKLYDELLQLEKETGVILSDSPTQHVGYTVSTEWDKVVHEYPALSLNKTKDRNELVSWLNNQEGVLSWKCDGLTVVMTFDNHVLTSLASRGNGIVGELITANAPFIHGIPKRISYGGHMVVRGEAMISYQSFEEINNSIANEDDKYKTPRNLSSGTIRNLDSKVVAERNVDVKAFELVYCEEMPETVIESFELLESLGFDVVEYKTVTRDNLKETIEWFETEIKNNPYPSDGLVLDLNDIAYGKSLGLTSKFPRNAIAFKWNDDIYETKVTGIEWNVSKNSINPILTFETVNIDGADIARASIHNINIMKSLELGIDDVVEVYLANKIIPQVADNQTRSNTLTIPEKCPVCSYPTEIQTSGDGTEILICTNPNCQGKLLSKLSHFVSRDCMNIDGLSEATLEKFIDIGWLNSFADIYYLHEHKNEMMKLAGFGKKSVEKLLDAIEKSSNTTLERFLAAISIYGIGKSTAKDLSKYCNGDLPTFIDIMCTKGANEFTKIDGFGDIMATQMNKWWNDVDGEEFIEVMMNCIAVVPLEEDTNISVESDIRLNGKTFCITGKLARYVNRDILIAEIEHYGGKYVSSVSAKTNYLINNDVESTSGKNKKAHEVGCSIISEEDFMQMIGVNE